VVVALRVFNRHQAKLAAIYFEELEMAQTITLGLSGA